MSLNWTAYCGDSLWDSELSWNTSSPRFTSCFQHTALTWPAPMLVISPLLIRILIKPRSHPIRWRFYNSFRQVLTIGLAIVAIIDLVHSLRDSSQLSSILPARIVSPILQFLFAAVLNVIFYRAAPLDVQSSGSIWFTLALSVLCGALSVFASVADHNHDNVVNDDRLSYSARGGSTHLSLTVINLVLTLTLWIQTFVADPATTDTSSTDETSTKDSDGSKRHGGRIGGTSQKIESGTQPCPKERATFFSRLVYSWYSSLTYIGWGRPLVMADVWRTRPADSAKINYEHYRRNAGNTEQNDARAKSDHSGNKIGQRQHSDGPAIDNREEEEDEEKRNKKINVLRIIWASFSGYFLLGAAFKLLQDTALFLNPMIMKKLMTFVKDPTEQTWHGYLYAVALFSVSSCQIMALNFYFNRMQTFGMRVRTQLSAAIYRKALNLSTGARAQFTTGEIVNLMSVDAQRFVEISNFINLIWSAPLQIVVSLVFLWRELGISVLGGFFFMVILIPINGYLTSLTRKLQVKQMKLKDERVKAMNELLSGIKIIKLYGWETAFIAKIREIREREIAILRQMNYLNCALVVLWNLAPFLVSLITFALYVVIDTNRTLTAEKAFVSLALFNILRFPLTMLPNLVTSLIMASVSVKRLNNFLSGKELSNYITPLNESSGNCIELSDCSFRWSKTITESENKPDTGTLDPDASRPSMSEGSSLTLSKLNLKIQSGSFVAIVGSVGSGKSSFLNAVLGNMEKVNGSIRVLSNQHIAYTPQEAWIQNSTLRDNILFGEEFDEQRYRKVVSSCSLLPDFEILPGGDLTEIGEKGINLSGGQKQRVSLARACYSNADIYLLDDPLAAVDSHVGKFIFENVLHSETGLLRDKTRILVTNSLSILPSIDEIIVLKEGHVIESGRYRDLIAMKNGHFAKLIQQYASQHPDDDEDDAENEESSEQQSHSAELQQNNQRASVSRGQAKSEEFAVKKLIEKEGIETGKVKWSVYTRYLRSITLVWFSIFLVAQIISQAANVGSNLWLSKWAKLSEDGLGYSKTIFYLSIYGVIGISQGVFSAGGYYSLTKGVLRAALDLHNKMLHTILRSSMAFFDVTPLGRILNRFSNDIDVCDSIIQANLRVMTSCFFSALATIVVISMELPLFLLVVAPIAIAFYFIQKLYISTARQLKRLQSITKSPVFSHFSETLTGVATIRAYSVTDQFIDKSDSHMDVNNSCYFASLISNRWLSVRLEMIANLIVLSAACFAVLYRGKLDAASVGLIISYALNTTQQLNYLVRSSADVETNIVSVERILEYTDLEVEAEWNVEKDAPGHSWPSEGVLEFRDYSTRYREGLDLVLKNVQFHIRQGEKIGIVGRTGAGKSSLTLALFRLIEPTNGTIVIDGIDITKIGLHQLRQHLTIIPQDPVLFSGTIRTNLDPFNERTDAELWSALELAHLKSFVHSNSEGLDYIIAESGSNLSMGQRQLVCLARALLRKSKVLVLDEATATVDMETDELIGKTIRSSFRDCTIFTIAHRLHTIMDSTRVLVLHNGEVAEFDSPENLLANSKSIFYSMAQAAGISVPQ